MKRMKKKRRGPPQASHNALWERSMQPMLPSQAYIPSSLAFARVVALLASLCAETLLEIDEGCVIKALERDGSGHVVSAITRAPARPPARRVLTSWCPLVPVLVWISRTAPTAQPILQVMRSPGLSRRLNVGQPADGGSPDRAPRVLPLLLREGGGGVTRGPG